MKEEKWTEALNHLESCEKAYSSIGSAGHFGLVHVIRPLCDRVNAGEKSKKLADEILNIS